MRSFDRGVEFQFALRGVAEGALIVAELRAAGSLGRQPLSELLLQGSLFLRGK